VDVIGSIPVGPTEKNPVESRNIALNPRGFCFAANTTPGGHVNGISFTAIDFETANNFRASACAVGLTKVRSGKVVDKAAWLMTPLPGYTEFSPVNVGIHGITASRVRGMPDWNGI
jgi:hypothetical protein